MSHVWRLGTNGIRVFERYTHDTWKPLRKRLVPARYKGSVSIDYFPLSSSPPYGEWKEKNRIFGLVKETPDVPKSEDSLKIGNVPVQEEDVLLGLKSLPLGGAKNGPKQGIKSPK